jgi:hypothetical protein
MKTIISPIRMNKFAVVIESKFDFCELELNSKILFGRISDFKGLNN